MNSTAIFSLSLIDSFLSTDQEAFQQDLMQLYTQRVNLEAQETAAATGSLFITEDLPIPRKLQPVLLPEFNKTMNEIAMETAKEDTGKDKFAKIFQFYSKFPPYILRVSLVWIFTQKELLYSFHKNVSEFDINIALDVSYLK